MTRTKKHVTVSFTVKAWYIEVVYIVQHVGSTRIFLLRNIKEVSRGLCPDSSELYVYRACIFEMGQVLI